MNKKPLVAVIGRPNVGKSTFFNKMAGRRISIVEDLAGVTRDRIYADVEWSGFNFTMIDTGGIELKSNDEMWMHIKKQAEIAMELADLILFMVDAKTGLLQADIDVADFLRLTRKPILLCVNKVDNAKDESNLWDFYSLGLGTPYGISAEQSLGLGDLLDAIVEKMPKIDAEALQEGLKIAIIGKPNAGKSSLANRLLGFDRSIVSNIPGTTRDAIDTPFTYKGKNYTIIDTAGVRKKKAVGQDGLEYYSVIRSLEAVKRADVVLVVIDSEEMLTEQDTKLCGYVHEQGKPSIIVMNKWDLIEKDNYTMNEFTKKLTEELKFMSYFVPVYVSALVGKRVEKIMETVEMVYENNSRRITTGLLNDVIMDAIRINEPPSDKGRRVKFFYSTQVAVNPPAIVCFVNNAEAVHFSYKRYLENALRAAFNFKGTPVRFMLRNKSEENESFN